MNMLLIVEIVDIHYYVAVVVGECKQIIIVFCL